MSGANPNKCYIPFQLSILSELISLIEQSLKSLEQVGQC